MFEGKVLAVDLDATLCEYDHWVSVEHFGRVLKANVDMLRTLKDMGVRILIHTCRMNGQWPGENYERSYELLKKWLDDNEVPYDKICTQKDGKPFAHAYFGDNYVGIEPNKDSYILADAAFREICRVMGRYDDKGVPASG